MHITSYSPEDLFIDSTQAFTISGAFSIPCHQHIHILFRRFSSQSGIIVVNLYECQKSLYFFPENPTLFYAFLQDVF